jgi:hypothetical protein
LIFIQQFCGIEVACESFDLSKKIALLLSCLISSHPPNLLDDLVSLPLRIDAEMRSVAETHELHPTFQDLLCLHSLQVFARCSARSSETRAFGVLELRIFFAQIVMSLSNVCCFVSG